MFLEFFFVTLNNICVPKFLLYVFHNTLHLRKFNTISVMIFVYMYYVPIVFFVCCTKSRKIINNTSSVKRSLYGYGMP